MNLRVRGHCLWGGLASTVLLAALAVWSTDVDTFVDAADRAAIESLGVNDECSGAEGLERQIECVRAIQSVLASEIPDQECVDERGVTSHEPAEFLRRRRGCCYDRSRLIEKTLSFYGLEVRHVAIYHTTAPLDLVRGGLPSHSLSEVRTDAGWMTIDSIQSTIGITRTGTPLDTVRLGEALRGEGHELGPQDYTEFFDGRFLTVYGLYSRHGGFYAPHVPLPDVDWAQLHHNI